MTRWTFVFAVVAAVPLAARAQFSIPSVPGVPTPPSITSPTPALPAPTMPATPSLPTMPTTPSLPGMTTPPSPSASGPTTPPRGQVWVDTSNHVYYCPGTQYFGRTAHGTYQTEAAAKAAGNHPVNGKACS
jgi:hypothetical protein